MALNTIRLIVVGQKVMSGEEYVPQDFIVFFSFNENFLWFVLYSFTLENLVAIVSTQKP